jgi:hypothetical protein
MRNIVTARVQAGVMAMLLVKCYVVGVLVGV